MTGAIMTEREPNGGLQKMQRTARGNRGKAILGVLLDILPPTLAYFGLRAAKVDTQYALLASVVVSGARTAWMALRTHRFDAIAGVLTAVYGLSFATAVMTGDQRFLLLRDSFTTGGLAIVLLLSCVVGKPLVFLAARRAMGAKSEEHWNSRWAGEPGVRHTFHALTLTWGAALLLEALVRVPLVYVLPVDTMVGLSSGLQAAAIIVLLAWSVRYVRQRRRAAVTRQS